MVGLCYHSIQSLIIGSNVSSFCLNGKLTIALNECSVTRFDGVD